MTRQGSQQTRSIGVLRQRFHQIKPDYHKDQRADNCERKCTIVSNTQQHPGHYCQRDHPHQPRARPPRKPSHAPSNDGTGWPTPAPHREAWTPPRPLHGQLPAKHNHCAQVLGRHGEPQLAHQAGTTFGRLNCHSPKPPKRTSDRAEGPEHQHQTADRGPGTSSRYRIHERRADQ